MCLKQRTENNRSTRSANLHDPPPTFRYCIHLAWLARLSKRSTEARFYYFAHNPYPLRRPQLSLLAVTRPRLFHRSSISQTLYLLQRALQQQGNAHKLVETLNYFFLSFFLPSALAAAAV